MSPESEQDGRLGSRNPFDNRVNESLDALTVELTDFTESLIAVGKVIPDKLTQVRVTCFQLNIEKLERQDFTRSSITLQGFMH